MEDVTPLNLEDHPKLFGLRYDQLIAILGSLIVSTQLYSWLSPVPFGGHDLRLDVSILLGLIGPAYALITMNGSSGNLDCVVGSFFSPGVYIPGPDPNPTRFLLDEELIDFYE